MRKGQGEIPGNKKIVTMGRVRGGQRKRAGELWEKPESVVSRSQSGRNTWEGGQDELVQ